MLVGFAYKKCMGEREDVSRLLSGSSLTKIDVPTCACIYFICTCIYFSRILRTFMYLRTCSRWSVYIALACTIKDRREIVERFSFLCSYLFCSLCVCQLHIVDVKNLLRKNYLFSITMYYKHVCILWRFFAFKNRELLYYVACWCTIQYSLCVLITNPFMLLFWKPFKTTSRYRKIYILLSIDSEWINPNE